MVYYNIQKVYNILLTLESRTGPLPTMRPTTIGIVSIGDMGLGMARLLKAHDYRVVTVAEGRRYGARAETLNMVWRTNGRQVNIRSHESALQASRPYLPTRS